MGWWGIDHSSMQIVDYMRLQCVRATNILRFTVSFHYYDDTQIKANTFLFIKLLQKTIYGFVHLFYTNYLEYFKFTHIEISTNAKYCQYLNKRIFFLK